MVTKFPHRNRIEKAGNEGRFAAPDKEKEMNEKLSRIEDSYVDAAIRQAERKRGNSVRRTGAWN
jgi:hypothetical protein